MEPVSFQQLRMLLVNMEYSVLPPHRGMKLWNTFGTILTMQKGFLWNFFNTNLGRLFTRIESSWNIRRSNYTQSCCRYARSWDVSYFYSWFRKTSTDISRFSNATVSCNTWTFFWRRRNTLRCDEASIWYILSLINIF